MGRQPAWIKTKCNLLVNEKCINALYRASQAGARIDCVVGTPQPQARYPRR